MITTCSECAFYRVNANNLSQGICYFNPPTAYPVAGPAGDVGSTSIRPSVRQDDPACAQGQSKVLA
jgi:hypothetical protein